MHMLHCLETIHMYRQGIVKHKHIYSTVSLEYDFSKVFPYILFNNV